MMKLVSPFRIMRKTVQMSKAVKRGNAELLAMAFVSPLASQYIPFL